jgi:hypothetical protein
MPFYPINYPEDKPGAGLAAIEHGYRLEQRDGNWGVDSESAQDAPACQAWLDAYDDQSAQRIAAKQRVKDEASARILKALPIWKQLNLLREPDGMAQIAAIVDPIRDVSNAMEGDIDAMSAWGAHEFDPTTSPAWPDAG